MDLNNLFNQSSFDQYAAFLKSTSLSDSSIQRKLSSLSSFYKFLIKKKLIQINDVRVDRCVDPSLGEHTDSPLQNQQPKPNLISKIFQKIKPSSPIKGASPFLPRYIIILTLFTIGVGIGFALYQQAFLRSQKNLAYSTASSPIIGGRFLSFQGRLTDSSGNPIVSSTGIIFKLYNVGTTGVGTTLYTSESGNSQTIVPDSNGIFSVTIGQSHGGPIPSSVFTENSSIWLEITAGGETMSPRQPIATVGYAINSETLQGMPPSASGLKNTVLVIDASGNLNLGETSPTIKSTSGTLGIEGQAVLLKASDGSGGNITINPDANGEIKLITEGTGVSDGFINATNANLTSGNLFNGSINNTNRGYNFINFSNYNIGTSTLTSRFSVNANGNTNIGGTMNAFNISIGNTLITATASNLNLLSGLTPSSGSIIYSTGTNLATSSIGVSGQLLMSNASGAPSWIDPSLIGHIYNASNGLSLAGTTFQLGGTLNQNTDIGFSGFSLTFSDGGSTFASFSSVGNVFNNPTSFLSGGDVSMAYDLNFTNSTGSNINTAGPLSINTGEVFNSSNLTLQTYNAGKIILNSSNLWTDGTNFGIGTTNPLYQFQTTGVALIGTKLGIGATSTAAFNVVGNGNVTTNFSIGGTMTLTGTNVLGTGTTALFIDSSGNITKRALGTMAFDSGPYDNYNNWKLQSNGAGTTSILTGNTVNFVNGVGISLVQSGSSITVNSTSVGTTYVATNGLNLTSGAFGLGGTLTKNTNIGVSSFGLSFLGSGNIQGLYLASNSYVGIGTTNPLFPLDVNGSINIAFGQKYNVGGTQINLNNLSDVFTSTPLTNQILAFNGSQWVNTNPGEVSSGNGVNFYLDDSSSSILTYGNLFRFPAGGSQVADSSIVNNSTGSLDSYISSALSGSQIDGGDWEFDLYDAVDDIGGTSTITANVYKRDAGGTETFLFSITTPEINHTIVSADTISTVQPSFPINSTDRLLVKFSANTTNTSNTTVTMTHNGTIAYSHIHSPLVTRHNDLAGLQGGTANEYYHLTAAEYTGTGTGTFVRQNTPTFTGGIGVTGNSVFSNNLTIGGTFVSVGSNNLVTNLNADLLDGLNSTAFVGTGNTGNFLTNLTNGIGITITSTGSSRNITFDYGASLLATGNKMGLNLANANTWTGIQTFITNPNFGPTSNNPEKGNWNILWTAAGVGHPLYEDEEFAAGTNGVAVYNNTGGGNVTITRIGDTSAPNTSGYVLQIYSTGTSVSPGLGGFVQTINARRNTTFVQRFRAKIPVGYNVVLAENSQGTNNTSYWLTPVAGTGKWEEYIRVSQAGNTGTFSGGGHVYLNGAAGTPVTWYLASCNAYESEVPLTSEYLRNQFGSDQTFNFRISGNGMIAGSLGLGSTAAGYKLNVVGAAQISTNLSVGGTSYFAGNVGIGTTNPLYQFQTTGVALIGTKLGIGATSAAAFNVVGNGNITGNLTIGGTLTGVGSTNLVTNLNADFLDGISSNGFIGVGQTGNFITNLINGTDINITSSGNSRTINNTSTLSSVTDRGASTSNLLSLLGGAYFGSTNQSILKNDGSIGIGTTSPQSALEVRSGTNARLTINRIGAWGTSPADIKFNTNDIGSDYWTFGMKADSTNNFYLDRNGSSYLTVLSAGNVGIGTTNPLDTLDVKTQGQGSIRFGGSDGRSLSAFNAAGASANFNFNGGANFNGNLIGSVFMDSGTNKQSIKVSSTTTSLWTNSLERLTVDNSGNVGIGTTAPTKKLDVTGDINLTGTIFANGTSGTSTQILSSTGTGLAWVDTSSIGSIYTATNGLNLTSGAFGLGGTLTQNTQIGTSSFNLSFLGLGNTQSLYLKSNGNVGIGTTNPGAKLSVQTSGTTDILNLFETGGTEVFTVLETGNVGIGTTNPLYKLDINGNANIGTTLNVATITGIGSTTLVSNLNANYLGGYSYNNLPYDNYNNWKLQSNGASTTSILTGNTVNFVNGVGISLVQSGSSITVNSTGTTYVANNGIGLSGNTLQLGGTLVKNTSIGTSSFNLDFVGLGGTQSLHIDETGLVGIGTTAPTQALEVAGNIKASNYVMAQKFLDVGNTLYGLSPANVGSTSSSLSLSAAGSVRFNYNDNTGSHILTGVASRIQNFNNGLLLATSTTTAGTVSGWDNNLFLASGGNVGIGTTNPAKKLDITGDLKLTGTIFTGTGVTGTSGQVLTSDGNGGLTWSTVSVGTGSTSANPAGQIVAFASTTCPTGWTEYTAARGRQINGYDTSQTQFNTIGKTGGEINHTLTQAELPNVSLSYSGNVPVSGSVSVSGSAWIDIALGGYSHNTSGGYDANGFSMHTTSNTVWGSFSGSGTFNGSGNYSGWTSALGSGSAHNVLDPYITLIYCQSQYSGSNSSGYWSDQGTYISAINTTAVVVTDSGNVGIGTTNPQYGKLEIKPTIGDANTGLTLYDSSATTGRLWLGSGDLLLLTKGATPSNGIAINVSGNVGIGTTNPIQLLSVSSGSTATVNVASFLAPALSSGNLASINFGKAFSADQAGELGYVYNSTAANSFAYLANYGDSGATGIGLAVRAGGNVGIGTTAPAKKLDVAGDIKLTGTIFVGAGVTGVNNQVLASNDSGGLQWVNATSGTTNGLQLIGTNIGLGGTLTQNTNIGISSFDLDFIGLGNNQSLHIDTNGNIGIGNTNPSKKLDIGGDIKLTGSLFVGTGTTGANGQVLSSDGVGGLKWISTNTVGNGVTATDPGGQIVAFASTTCPTGWSEYTAARGRNIIGYDTTQTEFNTIGKTGGEKAHTQSIAEMPTHSFTVTGLNISNPTGAFTINDNSGDFIAIADNAAPGVNGTITINKGTNSLGSGTAFNVLDPYVTLIYCQKNTSTSGPLFWTDQGTYISAVNATDVVVSDSGNLGIGTTNPLKALDIVGDIKLTGSIFVGAGVTGANNQVLASNGSGGLQWVNATSGTTNGLQTIGTNIGLGGTLTQNTQIGVSSFNLSFLGLGNTQSLYIRSNGNVGIGNTNPSKKLDLVGDLKLTGTIFTGVGVTGASGQVLSSDGAGGLVWINPTVASTGVTATDPGGQIVAFASTTCPTGWGEYTAARGRNIMGYDTSQAEFNTIRGTGGNKNYTLVQNNLPVETMVFHTVVTSPQQWSTGVWGNPTGGYASIPLDNNSISFTSSNWSQSFSLLNPYITLIYCQKSSSTSGPVLWTDQGTYISAVNSTNVVISDSGNVGIGTTSPGTLLQIGSRTGVTNTGAIRLAYLNTATGGNNAWDIGTGNAIAGGLSDNFYIYDSSNTTAARLMIQNSSGNVGIGTTAPTQALEVAGNIKASNYVMAQKFLDVGNTLYGLTPANVSSTNSSLALSAAGSVRFNYNDNTGSHILTGVASRIQNFNNGLLLATSTTTAGTVSGWDNNLFLASGGNVGIGTTSPLSKLQVQGDASGVWAGDSGQLIISGNTDNTKRLAFMIDTTANIGVIQAQKSGTGSYNLALNPAGGFVGIGTTSPTLQLQIYTNVNSGMGQIITNPNSGSIAYSLLGLQNNIAGLYMFLNSSTRTDDGGINTATLRNDAGALRLQSYGSYGIQIASSTGNAKFDANILPSTVSNTGGGTWLFGSGAWSGDAPATGNTNSVTGIGYNSGSGSQLFTLSSASGSLSLQTDGSLFAGDGIGYNPYGANGGSDGYLVVQNGGSFGGDIYSNGGINVANFVTSHGYLGRQGYSNNTTGNVMNSWWTGSCVQDWVDSTLIGNAACLSDQRLKKDVTNITSANGLEAILKLNPVNFDWIDTSHGASTSTQYGFIAQQVQEIFPDLVTNTGITTPEAPNGLLRVDYNGLIPVAIKGIQDLNAKIINQTTDINLTATGQVNVNYNINPEVLTSLGYDGAKNEIQAATYSITDSLGNTVNRIGQFSELAVGKLKAGLVSTTNLIAENAVVKNLITDKLNSNEIVSPKGNFDQLTAASIQATDVVTDTLTAKTATISTLYADNIISKGNSITDIMADKVNSLRDELTKLVSSNESTSSTITGTSIMSQSSEWSMDIASDSAKISGDLAITNNLIIGAKLTVNGDTQLGNAFITGTFTAGQIAIKDNFIETTNTALYLQPSGTGSVHIMGDSMVIAENGEVQINGNLTVSGSLMANLITAHEIQTEKLTANEIHVATDSANIPQIASDSSQPIIAESGFGDLATSSAELTSNATAGTATLPAHKTELVIKNNKITPNSMIYLTPVGSTKNQVLYVKNKIISQSDSYFTIALDNYLDQDIQINWWIIN